MIHLSYEQEITLIKRLVMAQGVSEEDAASLAAVVTHSDFTGTYSHGLSRLCIYFRVFQLDGGHCLQRLFTPLR